MTNEKVSRREQLLMEEIERLKESNIRLAMGLPMHIGPYVHTDELMYRLYKNRGPDARVDMNSLSAMLGCCHKISMGDAASRVSETGGRDFILNTPVGAIRVYAKTADDNPKLFPGIYIDILRWGKEDTHLCTVEYDHHANGVFCTVHDGQKTPVENIRCESCDSKEGDSDE